MIMIDNEIRSTITEYFISKTAFYLSYQINTPYSGCYYEPNVLIVDPSDKIKPLYSTGRFSEVLCGLESPMIPSRLIQLLDAGLLQHKISDIECVAVGDTPINDALSLDEHYWVHAVLAAQQQGIFLRWRCLECDGIYEGRYDEDLPEFTSYKGNGGVGVYMMGAMCHSCVQSGLCRGCGDNDPIRYDSDIASEGYDLCEECTHTLLEGSMEGNVEINDDVVLIKRHKEYVLVDKSGNKIKGLLLDQAIVKDRVSKLYSSTLMAFSEIHLSYDYVVDCMEYNHE